MYIYIYIHTYIHTYIRSDLRISYEAAGLRYRVAKTHRIPYLYTSFSAKVTYI